MLSYPILHSPCLAPLAPTPGGKSGDKGSGWGEPPQALSQSQAAADGRRVQATQVQLIVEQQHLDTLQREVKLPMTGRLRTSDARAGHPEPAVHSPPGSGAKPGGSSLAVGRRATPRARPSMAPTSLRLLGTTVVPCSVAVRLSHCHMRYTAEKCGVLPPIFAARIIH